MAYGSILGQSQSVLSPATAIKMGLEPTASADDVFDKLTGSVLFKADTTVIKTEQTTFQPTPQAFPGIACFLEPIWDGKNNKYIPADNKIQICKQINRSASDDPTLPTDTWGYWAYRYKEGFYKYYIPSNSPTSYLYCEEGSNSYSSNTYIMGTTFKITAIEFGESSNNGHLTNIQGAPIQIPSSQILNGVRMATGSYVGTGQYGSSNPNILTFDFEPKLVFVQYIGSTTIIPLGIMFCQVEGQRNNGITFTYSIDTSQVRNLRVERKGNTVNWYTLNNNSNYGPNYQLNVQNEQYNYIAFG